MSVESRLDPIEMSRAQIGPRDRNPPDSKEYAIQTLWHLKRLLEFERDEVRRIDETIAIIEQHEHWRVLGYESREQLYAVELGDLTNVGKTRLDRALKLAPHGTNQHTVGGSDATSTPIGRGAAYLLARLERDRPDLAARVRAGEMSANKAAISAGIVRVPTALEVIARDWAKLTDVEREEFAGCVLAWLEAPR